VLVVLVLVVLEAVSPTRVLPARLPYQLCRI